jgi:4-hydroxy-3-methylbut-2-enyl diphosphate reductase
VLIAEQTAAGRRLLLYGEPEHPEVKGLVSYAGEHFLVFDSPAGLRDLLLDAGPLGQCFLAAQTTQDRAAFVEVRRIVCDVCGRETPVLDTICDATKERQEEVRRIAGQVDFMVVVGGRNSGNTRRLTDVARSCSVPCIHIETASELDGAVPVQCRTIGLAAGASTPADIIRDVHQTLLSR